MKRVKKSIIYRRCESLAQTMIDLGYSAISWEDFRYLIMRYIGADLRTIRKYREAMQEFGFLEVRGNRFVIANLPRSYQKTLSEMEISK